MTAIGKFDAPDSAPAPADGVPGGTGHVWPALFAQLARALRQRGAHPGRTVVLLPYAQLMPLAKSAWLEQIDPVTGAGFVPLFETTMNWATRLGLQSGMGPPAGGLDIRFDAACDLLIAERLLGQAGLAAQRDDLAPALVEAAWQLASCVAARPPDGRAAWAATARMVVQGQSAAGAALADPAPVLRYERAVAQIALEWALVSGHASDALFDAATVAGVDCLVHVRGLQEDALAGALAAHFGAKAFVIEAWSGEATAATPKPASAPALHACTDASDEAERAAACALAHLAAGRAPVALAANDRSLVRRVSALLAARGVALRDETGWALSTTQAAATLMALLRAMPHQASTDAVLDWAKQVPALGPVAVDSLEMELRSVGASSWQSFIATKFVAKPENAKAAQILAARMARRIEDWRNTMAANRSLPAWLAALRLLLQASGQWQVLAADAAGGQVLQVLYLEDGAASELPASERKLGLGDFTRWASAVLEGANFKPGFPQAADVLILPLSQLLGRPFAAAVVPGCDEVHLPVSPEPSGLWSAVQRITLGLPGRAELQQGARAAWAYLMHRASEGLPVDVLWRTQEAGEARLASGFVQGLRLVSAAGLPMAQDPRVPVQISAKLTQRPQPHADVLPRQRLSASAYADLRACPYRYFGLRSLGLAEAEELDPALDKRDFGNWLHLVLKFFHEALASEIDSPGAGEKYTHVAIINIAAQRATEALGLDAAAFTPFAAAWPRVRDGYLQWLVGHEATGARFAQAELWREQPMGRVKLVGKIDRIDTLPDGQRLVIDYKTEASATTRQRLATPLDDTQLAFYAALLEDDALQAAYVNVGEKDGTRTYAMQDIVGLRNQLVDGILHDMERIGAGEALLALGEGSACSYCAARGLCRKDFWQ